MYSSSIGLRRNIFSRLGNPKLSPAFRRSQKTEASTSESREIPVSSAERDLQDNSARPFEDLPGPKGGLKYFVNFYGKTEGFTKGYKLTDLLFAEYGPVFKESMIVGLPAVHVIDPEDIERVFRAEGRYPRRLLLDIWLEHRKRRNHFPGVLLTDGEEWRKIRQSIAPKIMRPKIVEENIKNLNAVADDAITRFVKLNEVSHDHVPDLEGELHRWATESIGTVAFDMRLGLYQDPPPEEAVKFIEGIHTFFTLSHKLYYNVTSRLAWQYVDTPTFKAFLKCADGIFDIGQTFVDRKMREIKETTETSIDPSSDNADKVVPVLTYLLTRGDLTPKEVSGHAIDLVIGGVDTTSYTALWLLYNLARFPKVQEKLYQEINSIVGKNSFVTTENVAKLPYLKACAKESMRLTPVVTPIMRIVDQDVVLSGYNVPAQTTVVIQLYNTARSETYFKDPLELKPERWLRENKDENHAFSAVSFGFGPRMCLGRRVAELEIYVLICKLLQRFRLEYHHEPLELYTKLISVPDKLVKIKFVDR